MKKYYSIIKIVLLLMILIFVSRYTYADGLPHEAINCGINNGGSYTSGTTQVVASFYANSDDAIAARNAAIGTQHDGWDLYSMSCGSIGVVMNGTYWNCAGGAGTTHGGSYVYKELFGFPKEGVTCPGGDPIVSPPMDDADGDGMPDECDPYPDDPGGVIQVYAYQGDVESPTWIATNLTGGQKNTYGDYDDQGSIGIVPNAPWRDAGWLKDNGWCGTYEGGQTGENEDPLGGGGIEIPPEDNPNPTDEGVGNEGNTTETDYLEDIVTNTQTITNNQGNISDKLHQLHVDNVNSEIGKIKEQQQGEEKKEEELGNIDDVDTNIDGEFTELDKPEENLIEDILDDFLTNNPVQTVIDETTIDTTGSFCSFDWSYQGETIEFSICEYQTQLEMMGNILLAITSLCSLVIIMRK